MSDIERYLVLRPYWVPTHELVRAFSVSDRDLRSTNDKPGLLSKCTISGNNGYKHLRHATPAEVEHFAARLLRHSKTQADHAAEIKTAYADHQAAIAAELRAGLSFDRTGQGLLLS